MVPRQKTHTSHDYFLRTNIRERFSEGVVCHKWAFPNFVDVDSVTENAEQVEAAAHEVLCWSETLNILVVALLESVETHPAELHLEGPKVRYCSARLRTGGPPAVHL